MNLSVEISMYPLQEDYKAKIKAFLDLINNTSDDIEIRTSKEPSDQFTGARGGVFARSGRGARNAVWLFHISDEHPGNCSCIARIPFVLNITIQDAQRPVS